MEEAVDERKTKPWCELKRLAVEKKTYLKYLSNKTKEEKQEYITTEGRTNHFNNLYDTEKDTHKSNL